MIWIRVSCATRSASLRLQPTNTSILVVLPYPAIHKCVIQGLEMLQQPSDVANLPVPRTQTLQLRPRLAAHPETVQHRELHRAQVFHLRVNGTSSSGEKVAERWQRLRDGAHHSPLDLWISASHGGMEHIPVCRRAKSLHLQQRSSRYPRLSLAQPQRAAPCRGSE